MMFGSVFFAPDAGQERTLMNMVPSTSVGVEDSNPSDLRAPPDPRDDVDTPDATEAGMGASQGLLASEPRWLRKGPSQKSNNSQILNLHHNKMRAALRKIMNQL